MQIRCVGGWIMACILAVGTQAQPPNPKPIVKADLAKKKIVKPVVGQPLWSRMNENALVLGTNSRERFHVYPYGFFAEPRSSRPGVVAVKLIKSTQEGVLPSSMQLTTTELVGASTITMPLIYMGPHGDGKPPEKIADKTSSTKPSGKNDNTLGKKKYDPQNPLGLKIGQPTVVHLRLGKMALGRLDNGDSRSPLARISR